MLFTVMNIVSRSNSLRWCAFRGGAVFSQTCFSRAVRRAQCHRMNPLPEAAAAAAAAANFTQFDQRRSLCESSHSSARLLSPDTQQEQDKEEEQEEAKEEEDSIGHSPKPAESFNLDALVSLLRQENAVDLCVIRVPEHINYAQYFIVASGVSHRHLRAMALFAVKTFKFLKTKEEPHVIIEGKGAEDWMCIDFGTMVVHLMLPETRDTYELDKLWTLRMYDEQMNKIPTETLPEDFVLDLESTK